MNPIKATSILLLFASTAFANEKEQAPLSDTVHFDTVTIPSEKLAFGVDINATRPSISTFEISFRAFMSNEQGERFALATFKNSAGNAVHFDTKDIVGVLANGERVYPVKIDGEERILESGTLLLHFGKQKFPVIELLTRN